MATTGRFLKYSDLSPLAPSMTEEEAVIHITDVEAQALGQNGAPCLRTATLDEDTRAEVVSILRQAVLRWHRAGEGAVASTQATAGSFNQTTTVDTRARGGGRLYETELRQLRKLCTSGTDAPPRQAYTIRPSSRRRPLR